ncbi:MAG: hypothetical protein HYY55_04175 [Candidatus Niyogibacteria bacterium]|nr:MAG: hypothetical protein HYY55_04175 [Candidatus Niyogibacteria bacterium]
MEQEIYNKEYTIGKILSESWKKFKENFQLILLITLVVYIPVNIILAFIPIDALMEQWGTLRGFKIYMKVIQIFEGLIGIIASMAIAYIIKSKIDGQTISFGQALKKSMSRWPAAIGTNILFGIFLLGLTLLLIIPGIIYYVYWSFVLYIVVLQDKSGKSALDYSKAIVKGRWWKVAGYSLVFGLLGLIVGVIAGVPYWFLPDNFATSIATDTLIDVVYSFFTVVSIIFFINFDSTKKEFAVKEQNL